MDKLFSGCGPALPTLFQSDEGVDFNGMRRILEMQVEEGANFVVPCGTTGESATITDKEQIETIAFCVNYCDGEIPILAGTGSNNTREAVYLTKRAKEVGADGVLAVYPYYVKPTDAGVLDYYQKISEVGLPVIAYDIPGRTGGKGLSAEIIISMAKKGIIHGLKWASGDENQLKKVISKTAKDFMVLSGDDNATLKLMKLGGDGVISVVSNIVPNLMSAFIEDFQRGNVVEARNSFQNMFGLMEAMFLETNPIPVKTALSLMRPDIFGEVFRSPIVPMANKNKKALKKILKEYNLL